MRYRMTLAVWGIALPALALTLMALPVRAASHQTARLDQAQTQFQGGLSVRVNPSQTLSAGRRGLLMRVSAPLCTAIAGSMVSLTISSKVGRTTRSASAALSLTTSSSDCVWRTFTFKHPLSVHVGQVVRLTMMSRRGEAPLWGANLHGGDPYHHGAGAWMGPAIQDFAFRTYVTS